ncbi:MAG: hypothetical protein GX605_03450 [Chloroflexi bacterium]|nr:hypothetical protein [Chloroflexota bacterium]
MQTKPMWLRTALPLLLVLAAAFWWLNVQLAHSRSEHQVQMSTITSGLEGKGPLPLQGPLTIHMPGQGGLSQTIRRGLAAALGDGPFFTQANLSDDGASPPGQPLLLVRVQARRGLWTPFFARATLQVQFAYGSDGQAWWPEEAPHVVNSTGQPQAHVHGELTTTDVSWGLLPRAAYDRHLGRQAAARLAGQLEQALGKPLGY